MGDRANILVKESNDSIYLYTHWNGTELPVIAQKAMVRGQSRWDDFQYLTRILFCEMVRNDIDNTTGYGITSRVHDGGDKIIEIDVDSQTVKIGSNTISFKEFVDNGLDWKD